MNVLGFGAEGTQVEQLQQRLNEIYEEQLDVDGIFGELTEQTVIDFQESKGLEADGIVGPDTWQALYEEDEVEGEDAPELPGTILQSQLTSLFGKPRDPAPYLVVIDLAEFKAALAHVRDFLGHPWSCRVYGHKMMAAPLKASFKSLVDGNLAKELATYDGCVCVRPMTSGGGWSVHSWGLAIDFNARTNGYGKRPTLSHEFVKCFTDAGFEWGGRWSTPDGMHFQLPKTRG